MKKMILLFVLLYVVIMGVVAYFYFGPGLLESTEPLNWQDLKTDIPAGFKVKNYQSKGWDVYNMTKLFTNIRIAIKDAFDVRTLPNHHKKVRFNYSTGPGDVYFVTNERKAFQAVFARTIQGKSVYISATTASAYSCVSILERVAKNASYKGIPLNFPDLSLPVSVYTVDFIMLAGLILPVFILFIVFYFSGKRPNARHFEGDPIRCEEEFVYLSSKTKWRRNSSFGYMVLTTTRFMVFAFKKKTLEIKMNESDPDTRIDIDGKKIIVHEKNRKLVLKPADIRKWQDCLSNYM